MTYSIDGQRGIDDPLGMTGVRLEVEVQSIMSPTATVQNVVNCAEPVSYTHLDVYKRQVLNELG